MVDVVEECSFPHLSMKSLKLVPCHFRLVLFLSFSASTTSAFCTSIFVSTRVYPVADRQPLKGLGSRSGTAQWASHEFENGCPNRCGRERARERLPCQSKFSIFRTN